MAAPKLTKDAQTGYEEAQLRIKECLALEGSRLDLTRLGLTELPPAIVHLRLLRELFLPGNNISIRPKESDLLKWLTVLDMTGNRLESLPLEIGQMAAMTQLDLSSNWLWSLSKEIGQLGALTKLELANNQFCFLPPEIGKLSALTQLNVFDNQLRSLFPEIGELTALREPCGNGIDLFGSRRHGANIDRDHKVSRSRRFEIIEVES